MNSKTTLIISLPHYTLDYFEKYSYMNCKMAFCNGTEDVKFHEFREFHEFHEIPKFFHDDKVKMRSQIVNKLRKPILVFFCGFPYFHFGYNIVTKFFFVLALYTIARARECARVDEKLRL